MRIITGRFESKPIWEGTPIKDMRGLSKSMSRTGADMVRRGGKPKSGLSKLFGTYHIQKDSKKDVWYLLTPGWQFAGMYGSESKAIRARKLANAGKLGKALLLAGGATAAVAASQGAFS